MEYCPHTTRYMYMCVCYTCKMLSGAAWLKQWQKPTSTSHDRKILAVHVKWCVSMSCHWPCTWRFLMCATSIDICKCNAHIVTCETLFTCDKMVCTCHSVHVCLCTCTCMLAWLTCVIDIYVGGGQQGYTKCVNTIINPRKCGIVLIPLLINHCTIH